MDKLAKLIRTTGTAINRYSSEISASIVLERADNLINKLSPSCAPHANAISIRGGVLLIVCKASSVMNEITLYREQIFEQLQTEFGSGKIKGIRLKIEVENGT